MAKFSEIDFFYNKVKFRTEFHSNQSFKQIRLEDRVLFLGSCFAENIGQKLLHLKMQGAINPLGIAYNPASLTELLYVNRKTLQLFDQKVDDLYFNYLLHSEFTHSDHSTFQDQINHRYDRFQTEINESQHVFISLGTAWYYRLKESGKTVNNCHKQPSQKFEKDILTVDECYSALEKMTSRFQKANVIFTVSPIRHLRDGFRENTISKSTLHLAVEQICSQYSNAYYFPSYELLLDDLRDYRFYGKDLIHPNQQGIEYIWEYFLNAFFGEKEKIEFTQRAKLLQSVYHRPFQVDSLQHQAFLKNVLTKLERQPNVFEQEIDWVKSQLISQ